MANNQDSVLGDYVLQLQKQKEERDRKQREQLEKDALEARRQKKADEERDRKANEDQARKGRRRVLFSILFCVIIAFAGFLLYNNQGTSITASSKYDIRYICRFTPFDKVIIPAGTKEIKKDAFHRCENIKAVEIPNSVTSIEESAFWGCSDLVVTVPKTVTYIGDVAFALVPNISYSGKATGSPWGAKSVNGFVDGNLVYNDATKTHLRGCISSATGTICIPSSVIVIEDYAFNNCHDITTIEIPNSVKSIGNGAFNLCKNLSSLTIPKSVTHFGTCLFGWCDSLTLRLPKKDKGIVEVGLCKEVLYY